MKTGLASTGAFKKKSAHCPPQVSQRKPYLCKWTVFMQTDIHRAVATQQLCA